jgi:hypothetical protein
LHNASREEVRLTGVAIVLERLLFFAAAVRQWRFENIGKIQVRVPVTFKLKK